MNHGLSADIVADFQRVFCHYPEITQVLLFGSRAKGTYRDGSDIDLAVMAANMSEDRFTALWNEIDALPLVFKVDLLHWDRLGNTALKDKVMQEGQKFFEPVCTDR